MYTEEQLRHHLSDPVERGFMLGTGSQGWKDTPWGSIKRAPLGDDQFMLWDCNPANLGPLRDQDEQCLAILPARGPKAKQGWFIVRACPRHKQQLTVTPFNEIFPHTIDTTTPPDISPMLLIADRDEFASQTGADWERSQSYLRRGWTMTLVHSDYRFPNHTFVVLENPSVSK